MQILPSFPQVLQHETTEKFYIFSHSVCKADKNMLENNPKIEIMKDKI